MAVLKCKMCGGNLEIESGITVAQCEYCGTKQTVSCSFDEKRINLYNRANRHRINGEFDRAATIYESIITEFSEDAEAYWCLVLCNYGIEYVDDPLTARKIPTCHRASFESIQDDENFKKALKYADEEARSVYREEAQKIDEIIEEILSVCKNEKPYDIFICFKQTDEDGRPTIDSVLAEKLYDALTEQKYKVFFSKISLQDKGGIKYEPYIFAALNSAKVMLVVGTSYDNYDAVWVKNEWSRFLKLMAHDKSKIMLPCFKDMPADELPKEFKALQAQDLGRVGVVQDIIRGIEKIIPKESESVKINKTISGEVTVETLLERAYILLRDSDFEKASSYFEKVLDRNPHESRAYWGNLLSAQKCLDNTELISDRKIQSHYQNLAQGKNVDFLSADDFAKSIAAVWGNDFQNACLFAAEDEKEVYYSCYAKLKNKLLEMLQKDKEERRKQYEAAQRAAALKKELEEKERERQRKAEQYRKEQELKRRRKKFITATIVSIINTIILFCSTVFIFTNEDFLNQVIYGNIEGAMAWIKVHILMIGVMVLVLIISKIGKMVWTAAVAGVIYFVFQLYVMIRTWAGGFGFWVGIGAMVMIFIEIIILSAYFWLLSKLFDEKKVE